MNSISPCFFKSCGKIILSGEHSVLYNNPAIAIPLKNMYTKIEISNIKCTSWEQSNDIRIINLIEKGLKFIDNTKSINDFVPKKINISYNIPLSSGAGSSASLCVTISKLISHILKKNIDIIKTANFLEHQFHTDPSGIDVSTIYLEQMIYFFKKKISIKKLPSLNCKMILIDSLEKIPTKNMIEKVKKNIDSNKFYIEKISSITDDILKSIETSNLKEFGKLLNINHLLLKQIGVVTTKNHDIFKKLNQLGSIGSKMTGGGGGIVFGIFKEIPDTINELKEFGNIYINDI